MKNIFLSLLIVCFFGSCSSDARVEIASPNGLNKITVLPLSGVTTGIPFQVMYKEQMITLPSLLELSSEEIDFSSPFSIENTQTELHQDEWTTTFGERSTVNNHYLETKVFLTSETAKLNIILRAYDEGVAFSYEVPTQSGLTTVSLDEHVYYNFEKDYEVWSTPKRGPGVLTAQGDYKKINISQLEEGCERPLLIEVANDVKVAIAEASLVDYARMSFNKGSKSDYCIVSSLDGRMMDRKQDKVTGALLSQRADGPKVKKALPFQSPWRVFMMGDSHAQLLEQNYLVENLNDACAIDDVSWIKPGKVLREVTLTTQGAFSAIDFAASHNMQYIMFDAGWYGDEMKNSSDATTITLDPKRSKGPLDIQTVTKYGKENGIGVILYVNRRALEKQLDDLLPLFTEWGIAGIKFGFVRVGDQDATAWMHEAIKKAAKYKLIVDVHDEYRPTGFSRTYPNLLTQEGIAGDEVTVPNEHTLITMFTRCLAGAADNTVCYYNARVEKMGSHASQLAKPVCIFSPLQFLYWYDKAPDAPIKEDGLWGDTRHIGNEPELEFFNNVPTTWDESHVIIGEIGKLGVIARRHGNDWFIGCINGAEARDVLFALSFLEEGATYKAKFYTDDESVKTRTRVAISEKELCSKDNVDLHVDVNNGFTIHIVKQ